MSMPVIKSSDTPREQAINDLMESIALQETGLSHIINAEGEKIQAAIEMKCICLEELLAVNKSVCETLGTIAEFERVLYDKLNLIINMLD